MRDGNIFKKLFECVYNLFVWGYFLNYILKGMSVYNKSSLRNKVI